MTCITLWNGQAALHESVTAGRGVFSFGPRVQVRRATRKR